MNKAATSAALRAAIRARVRPRFQHMAPWDVQCREICGFVRVTAGVQAERRLARMCGEFDIGRRVIGRIDANHHHLANVPVLLMSLMWRGKTTRGAVIGGFLGLITALIGVVLSASVWEAVMGHAKGSAPFPYSNPALFSMTIAFVGIWLLSKLDSSARGKEDIAGFDAQYVRAQTGIGATGASAH